MKSQIKQRAKAQGGFTLIEIIAVLVILGILAAVATPKFIDLQDDARIKALDGAFAAGQSQISMEFARGLLNGNTTASWSYSDSATLGDFVASLSAECGDDNAKVTITDGPPWFSDINDSTVKSKDFTICTN